LGTFVTDFSKSFGQHLGAIFEPAHILMELPKLDIESEVEKTSIGILILVRYKK